MHKLQWWPPDKTLTLNNFDKIRYICIQLWQILGKKSYFTLWSYQNSWNLCVNQWDVDPSIANEAAMLEVDVPQVAEKMAKIAY